MAPKANEKSAAPKKEKTEKKEDRPEDLIPKVPEVDYEAFDAKLAKVQEDIDKIEVQKQELNKKIGERSGGKDEFMTKRQELRAELDKWGALIDGERAKKEALLKQMGADKEQILAQKNELNKMKKTVAYTSEADIDTRIADLEFKRCVDSLTLKEEKELLKEISELKKSRPKVAQLRGIEGKLNEAKAAGGASIKQQLDEVNQAMNKYFDERRVFSEQLKALSESRKEAQGDMPALIGERDGLGEKIRALITERNKIKADKRQAEQEYYQYKNEVRKIKQERAAEERQKRQDEYDMRRRQRDAEKLDEQPYVAEITLIEQTILFCKGLTQTKGEVEKEEKKETVHDLPKDAEVLVKKEDREEFYYAPTARGKKGKSKATKAASSAKPIKHNAETFQLFDKLKLDAPLNTDAVPALLEILEAKLVDYQDKVKKWEQERDELKSKILAGEVNVDDIVGEKAKVEAEPLKDEEVPTGDA